MTLKPRNDVECNEIQEATIDPKNPAPEIDCSECRDKNICMWRH